MTAGEVGRALALLFDPGQVVEVRAITEEGIASGYFNDAEALASAVVPLDGSGTAGIYVTLNEVNPALLARRANRIKMRLSKKDATTADGDIVRRRWFPVDIDPVRPSGVSATDGEHRAALDRAAKIAAYLSGERGWPAPFLADSGNGAHLLYRIDLPNDDGSRDLVKRCLEVLDAIFSDGTCTIDTANYNAGRIWKLYGTTSRKGDHTAERPHRKGRVLEAPSPLVPVGRDQLESLAGVLPGTLLPEKSPAGRGKAIDLAAWLSEHGIGIAAEKPYGGGRLFVLEECPFSSAHRDGAFAIQFPSGAIFAGCHHASCGGGSQRWQELREKCEKAKMRRSPAETPPGQAGTIREPACSRTTPPGVRDELPGREEALAVLRHGDSKSAMLRTFAIDHEGDEVVAECLVLSLASRSVANTNGLHVSVTGESGKGKSHAFSTMLRQVPERFCLDGAMSNKALFYLPDLQPGSVIVLDDRSLSDEMAEILKGVTTSFKKPYVYHTVNKERRAHVCTIPERCVWWVAKVEGAGDDQVFNRMLTCWIDDSEVQDTRVLARVLARDEAVPGDDGKERPDVLVCRAMWEIIGQQRFHVVVPFATRIRFQAASNRRNPEMLLDLVKANTVLRFMQRESHQVDSVTCLIATRDDFGQAARLYALLNGTAGGQETKLTKREADLLTIIQRHQWPEFTIPMLQKASGWSHGAIYKIIHGHMSRGRAYSGLLEKCPALAYCDRTVVTAEESHGVSMRRRTQAYTFDPDLFSAWCGGGAVWIDDDPSCNSCNYPATGVAGIGNGFNESDFQNPSCNAAISCKNPEKCVAGIGNGLNESDSQKNCNAAISCKKPEKRVAGIGNGLNESDSQNISYNKNNYLCTNDSCNKSQVIEQHGDEGAYASLSLCDPRSVAGKKSNSAQSQAISDTAMQKPPICLYQIPATAPSVLQDCRNPSTYPIDAHDYKPLDRPERTPCSMCGGEWSLYVEKLTDERRKRPDRKARRVCRTCYLAAKKDAQARVSLLPGTFDLSRMEPLNAGVGQCTACRLDRAAYIDRETGTKLCEACYQRLASGRGQGEVTG